LKYHKGDRDLIYKDLYDQIDGVDEELKKYQESMKDKFNLFKKLELEWNLMKPVC
jgi:hypothetical protein